MTMLHCQFFFFWNNLPIVGYKVMQIPAAGSRCVCGGADGELVKGEKGNLCIYLRIQ